MSRRKNNQFAISLFSFQDIITSVTGVLILLVLLMLLELTQRTASGGLQAAYQASARQIRASLAQVNSEMEQVSAELEGSQELIRRATENPAGELRERIATESAAIDASRNRIEQLRTVAKNVSKAEQEVEEQKTRRTDSQARLAELRARIDQLEQQLAAFAKGGGSHYAVPDGVDGKLAWVCDASHSGLKLFCMEDPSIRQQFPVVGGYEKEKDVLFSKLLGWVESQKPDYILFVFRPSSAELGQLISLEGGRLRAKIGMDVVAEDHRLTDRRGVPIP